MSREFAIPTSLIIPTRAARFAGDPQVDWGKVMNGYNYLDALNGTGAIYRSPNQADPGGMYGMPNFFQSGRAIRLAMRFVF